MAKESIDLAKAAIYIKVHGKKGYPAVLEYKFHLLVLIKEILRMVISKGVEKWCIMMEAVLLVLLQIIR